MKENLKNYLKLFIGYFILVIPLGLLRFPDIKNEMKYFIITDQMLNSKNWFILKYFNELYPDKPPLYFWFLSLIKTLTNHYYFFNLLLLSSLFGFFIILLTYSLVKNLKNSNIAFLISYSTAIIPFFIGVSVLQRMDMMMSFFIFSSFYLFYGFYYNFRKISYPNLIIFYICLFLGIFIKGIAGIAIPLVTILIFLLLEKNLIFLKKIKFLYGISFIFFLIAIWFYNISISTDGTVYLKLLLGQETVRRIIKSKTHIRPFYYYITSSIYIFFPYGLTFLFLLLNYLKRINSWKNWDRLEKISFISSIVPFIILSLASGKLNIYLTPIIPWAIIFTLSNIEILVKNKFINFSFNFFEILLIFPLLLKKIKKNYNIYTRIFNINYFINILFIFIILILPLYNKGYTLSPFKNIIENKNIKVCSYKFPNSKNLSYLTEYEIENFDLVASIPKEYKYILIKNKNSDISLKDYSTILKNKKYSLLKNLH